MKKLLLISLSLLTLITWSPNTYAQMDPKIKALGSMALYGTVGGLLLGTASLAFGTEPRAIAKGASLGLYAGLLFGGYVVVSHMMKKKRMNQPPPVVPYGGAPAGDATVPAYEPYPEDANEYDSTYDETMDPSVYGQRWNPYLIESDFLKGQTILMLNKGLKMSLFFTLTL